MAFPKEEWEPKTIKMDWKVNQFLKQVEEKVGNCQQEEENSDG